MAGICSAHRHKEPGCALCAANPREVFPDWDKMVAAAKVAGEHTCHHCGFVYYRTTDMCPKCGVCARLISIIAVKSIYNDLSTDLLAFLSTWITNAGFKAPRIVHKHDGSFEVRAFDPFEDIPDQAPEVKTKADK
jgi:hypothetical protein